MSRGRGLAQMVIHMSHITPIGWCYMGGISMMAIMTWQASKKLIPRIIRYHAKKYYPNFEWIVIPHGIPISGLLFLCLCFPLGYFCEGGDDDVLYFKFMSVAFIFMNIIPILIRVYKQKCFMRNNQALFVSTFALWGWYRRITIQTKSIQTYLEGSEKKEQIIEFKDNKGKKMKINTTFYSKEGQKILFEVFGIEELTQ